MNWRSHHDWMAIIRKWGKTDMTQTEFCKEKKLSIKCFSYHYYKDQKSNEQKSTEKKTFVQVVCKEETPLVSIPPISNGSFYLHLDCARSTVKAFGFPQ